MIKKLLNIILVLMLCVCFVPSSVFAEDEIIEEEYIDEGRNEYISSAQFITNRQYLGYPNTDVLVNDFGTEGEKFIVRYGDGKTITYVYDKEIDLFIRTDSTEGDVDDYYDFLMPQWEFADSNQSLFKKGENLVLLSLFGFKTDPVKVIGKNPNVKIKKIQYIPSGDFIAITGETNPNNLLSKLPNINDKLIITYDDNSKTEYIGTVSDNGNVFKDKSGNELNSGQYYLAFTNGNNSYQEDDNTVDFCLIDKDGMAVDNSQNTSQYTHNSKINVIGVQECEHSPLFIKATNSTKEHYECEICGKLFSDEDCENEVSESDLETEPTKPQLIQQEISPVYTNSSPFYNSVVTVDRSASQIKKDQTENNSSTNTTAEPNSASPNTPANTDDILNSDQTTQADDEDLQSTEEESYVKKPTTTSSDTTQTTPVNNNITESSPSRSSTVWQEDNTNDTVTTSTVSENSLSEQATKSNTSVTEETSTISEESLSDASTTTTTQESLKPNTEEISYEYEESNSSDDQDNNITNDDESSNIADKIIAKTGDNKLLYLWISVFTFVIGIGIMFTGMKRIYN